MTEQSYHTQTQPTTIASQRRGVIYAIAEDMRQEGLRHGWPVDRTVYLNEATRIREIDPYGIDAKPYYDPVIDDIAYAMLPAVTSLWLRGGRLTFEADESLPDGEYRIAPESSR